MRRFKQKKNEGGVSDNSFWDVGFDDSSSGEETTSDDGLSGDNDITVSGNEAGHDGIHSVHIPLSDIDEPGAENNVNVTFPGEEFLNSDGRIDEEVSTSAVASLERLHIILKKLRCPILELAYFSIEDINKLMPPDLLSVSRSALVTLGRCTNTWTKFSSISLDNKPIQTNEERLCWSTLTSEEMDTLVLLLTKDQGSRLYLLQSDLNMLRKLPIFETLSGNRVSLVNINEMFVLDSSVDSDIQLYLPQTLKRKFLVEKIQLKDIFDDLGVKSLSEANILEKFVLPEFHQMSSVQKENVCQTILEKWSALRESRDFVEVLKSTAFVKRVSIDNDDEVVFVRADQLFDPRNDFLSLMFEDSQTSFPAEEFRSERWLEVLSVLGLKSRVDKDSFLQCAWRVETKGCTTKAMKLHEYYVEHFGEFMDGRDFNQKLSEVQCVPAEIGGTLSLYKFRDAVVPKDRHLAFKVLPVIPESICPPQVMYSSLGISSPPPIKVVLKQVRLLIEDPDNLDQWSYKFGTVDDVFSSVLSYLQEHYSRLSPRVQEALQERPLIPVGTMLVSARHLFFRLGKDLAPFFFEVPRVFVAYEKLLKELGVRDSPSGDDYAVKLSELKRELGEGRLNANELSSVVEILTLIADQNKGSNGLSSETRIYAPDMNGCLVDINSLIQDDCPWLIRGNRLDRDLVRIVHPKISAQLCKSLGIGLLSECISEHLADNYEPAVVFDESLKNIERNLRADSFISMSNQLVRKKSSKNCTILKHFNVMSVRYLKTRFILSKKGESTGIDITRDPIGTLCFIDAQRILVAKESLPPGITAEMVVATSICDYFKIDRNNVAGLSAMLASDVMHFDSIGRAMGVGDSVIEIEATRGDPGALVVGTDLDLVELKPLKRYNKGEIVALKRGNGDASVLIYGVIVESGGGSSLSRLRVRTENGMESNKLSSEIFSFRRGVKAGRTVKRDSQRVNMRQLSTSNRLVQPLDENVESIFENGVTDVRDQCSALQPIERHEVLNAVQDLLQSANLSLNDDVEKVLESNLKLREELSHRDAYVQSIVTEGNEVARGLYRGTEAFLCPITREIMVDPVICTDGHTYERQAIEQWFRSHSRSPKTNQHLTSRMLIPNHALRMTIEAMQDGMEAVKKFNGTIH